MTHSLHNMTLVLLALACGPAFAQRDEAAVPDVLVVGDSVYDHAKGAARELQGHANVRFATWPKGVLPDSTNVIGHLDLLLGYRDASGSDVPEGTRPTWDLVHFNVGLGDLVHCVPNVKSHRVLPYDAGGVIRTDAKQYEENLETLVTMLGQKVPDAKLVWASTTPIRHSREHVFKEGMEIEYNRIAERVMKRHGVTVNDMYAYAKSVMDMDKPAPHGFDPFFFDKKPLHPPVVEVVRDALKLSGIDKSTEIIDGRPGRIE